MYCVLLLQLQFSRDPNSIFVETCDKPGPASYRGWLYQRTEIQENWSTPIENLRNKSSWWGWSWRDLVRFTDLFPVEIRRSGAGISFSHSNPLLTCSQSPISINKINRISSRTIRTAFDKSVWQSLRQHTANC